VGCGGGRSIGPLSNFSDSFNDVILPPGDRLIVLESVDSTNEEACRLAKAGEKGGLWIVARTQSAGRGRRGRSWVSEPGNFCGSLILRPQSDTRDIANLSFVAAVALYETFAGISGGQVVIECDWPNDVLVGGTKVAGILLESSFSGDSVPDWVVVGIGVNLIGGPELKEHAFASLTEVGIKAVTPPAFLEKLAAAMQDWLEIWQKNGFEPIRTAWLARAAGLGERIVVRYGDEVANGIFADLSQSGSLILALPDGRRREILAADVMLDQERD
jgi:BirA family biotin operon repressor/biotin-[acetyl-CoA-carboxylase] ligase